MKPGTLLLAVLATGLAACATQSPPSGYPGGWAPLVEAKQVCPDLSGQYSYFGDLVTEAGPGRAALAFLVGPEWRPNDPPNRRATHVAISGPSEQRLTVSVWERDRLLYRGAIYAPSEFSCVNHALVRRWDRTRDATYAFDRSEDGSLVARVLRADYALVVAGKEWAPSSTWLRWRSVDATHSPEGRLR